MTWLKILLIAIVVGGNIGYITSGSKEGAKKGAASFGIGCGYILMHIFFALIVAYNSCLNLESGCFCSISTSSVIL